MDYFLFRVRAPKEWLEIFIAELSELGFEMMEEKEDCIEAFAKASKRDSIDTNSLIKKYKNIEGISFETGSVENQNWNENWEKNYTPIIVDNTCYIRAEFHEPQDFPYELIITPRMSFGTGHHDTTYLMVSYMLKNNFERKSVLDAGTGTGVLAILAKKLGASAITAYDVSSHCVENTIENMEVNNISSIEVKTGTLEDFSFNEPFDYILANINRNAIIYEMQGFAKLCLPGTKLVFSGFYEKDLALIREKAYEFGLQLKESINRNEWCCAVFINI